MVLVVLVTASFYRLLSNLWLEVVFSATRLSDLLNQLGYADTTWHLSYPSLMSFLAVNFTDIHSGFKAMSGIALVVVFLGGFILPIGATVFIYMQNGFSLFLV